MKHAQGELGTLLPSPDAAKLDEGGLRAGQGQDTPVRPRVAGVPAPAMKTRHTRPNPPIRAGRNHRKPQPCHSSTDVYLRRQT